MLRSNQAHEPQLLSLRVWSLCSATREAAIVRGPRTAMKSGPRSPQLEKALTEKRRPNTAINKFKITFLFFFFFYHICLFIYLFIFIFGCVGSSFLCEGFLQLWQAGAPLHRGARASHCRGLSRCGAQAPDAQAQQLWLMGLIAPQHVGSSQTRARTRVPCIGRQILNHCATREAPKFLITFYN